MEKIGAKVQAQVETDAKKDGKIGASFGLGIFFVIAGAFLLAREYGIFPKDLPILPVVVIGAGLFLIIQGIFARS